jgi:hypothetical protein
MSKRRQGWHRGWRRTAHRLEHTYMKNIVNSGTLRQLQPVKLDEKLATR